MINEVRVFKVKDFEGIRPWCFRGFFLEGFSLALVFKKTKEKKDRVGVFHAQRWGSKSSFPSSKVCFPWASRGLSGTDPMGLTLESTSPSPTQGSISHRFPDRFNIDSASISWFDPISIPNQPLRRGRQGRFEGEVRGSVPNKPLTTQGNRGREPGMSWKLCRDLLDPWWYCDLPAC